MSTEYGLRWVKLTIILTNILACLARAMMEDCKSVLSGTALPSTHKLWISSALTLWDSEKIENLNKNHSKHHEKNYFKTTQLRSTQHCVVMLFHRLHSLK